MAKNFNQILDECIDRINGGQSLEACLADYPEYREKLEPLLGAVLQTEAAYSFTPSAGTKQEARGRFNAALEKLERRHQPKRSLFTRLIVRPGVWATAAALLVVLMVGYFGLRPVLYPAGPVPSTEGNFVFLISDEVNAIGDFESLNVTIEKIGLQLGGGSGRWVEFEPQVEEVDLTLLPGDEAQQIWRGDVPEGQYTKVFIKVAGVSGVLKESGQTVEVKLPSGKLHMSKSFQVTAGTVTSFTYDLTVIAAGSPQSGIRYILKPQVGQSGADHEPRRQDGE